MNLSIFLRFVILILYLKTHCQTQDYADFLLLIEHFYTEKSVINFELIYILMCEIYFFVCFCRWAFSYFFIETVE